MRAYGEWIATIYIFHASSNSSASSGVRIRVLKVALSMASSQPRRQTADLRWRMVWQSEGLGHTYSAIAENLNVDKPN